MTSPVEELLREGRHGAAAETARAAGDAARAASIYAHIWEFGLAAACAREAGDRLAELGYLCDARDTAAAGALARELGSPAAAEVLARKRVFEPAAQLFEGLGELERAAELYRRAGLILPAALLLEKADKLHEAGRLLERAPGGGAPVALALGRILARLGQHEAAAAHLQEAARHAETRADAGRLLAGELLALGLAQAASDALAAARAADPTLPTTLAGFGPAPARVALIGGRYRPIRLLGGSSVGRVYQAIDEVTGAEVAVKVLAAPGAHGQPAYDRFVREAEVWRRAEHPNIVRILDLRDDLGFVAMELMTGGTLEGRLAGGKPLPVASVRRMALDVLAALAHAHDRGVVHRDVKPANIFFDGHGGAKLGDFGVAHLADLGQTQTGALIGTLATMSPEQITGAPLGAAADLYALGVTVFHALTGRLPFLGPDYIAQHLGDTAPAPSQLVPTAAPWDELVAGLLMKDPAARPQTAADVATAIRALAPTAPRTFVLPRGPAALPAEPAPAPSEAPRGAERYVAETPLGETPCSTLARALDRVLERTVVLERFTGEHPDAPTLARLRKLAATPSPYVQRVLAWDGRTAVYEAPVGTPPGPTTPAARLAEELGRALAAIHEQGVAHGALGGRVVFDDEAGVTVLVAGLGLARPEASVEDDLAEAAHLVSGDGRRA